MIFQIVETEYTWLLGLGIVFGLAFVLTMMSYKSLVSFFVYSTIFTAFVVWGGLLELWALVVQVVILAVVMILSFDSGGNI